MICSKKRSVLINLAIPFIVAILGTLIVNKDFSLYSSLRRPALAPPFYVFPIVWGALYILMGISTYLLTQKRNCENEIDILSCYILYAVSLVLNVLWMCAFFKVQKFAMALALIFLLVIIIFAIIFAFFKISKLSAMLQLPYLFWCIFAVYLNLSIYVMN